MPQATRDYLRVEFVVCGISDDPPIVVVGFDRAELMFEQSLVREVARQLYLLVEAEGLTRILLDFANVQYLSSTMLACLVGLKKRVERVGGQLKLCGLNPVVEDCLRAGRLLELFRCYDSRQVALDCF